jgi:hypothetical protein
MMKKIVSSLGIFIVVSVMGIFGHSPLGMAAEFSADQIVESPEGKVTGNFYVKGDKQRQEFVKEGEKTVTILHMDKGVIWNLMPEEKMYMEMPCTEKSSMSAPQMEKELEKMAEKKYLGKEKVSGYACEKYQYIYHDKSAGTLTQWVSKKLNYPIKTRSEGSKWHMYMELRNIKEQRLSDSLFEIPAGYKKMSIPGMPGDMSFPK